MAEAAGGVAVESPASAHLRGWAINDGDGLVSFFTDEPAERLAPKAVPALMILGCDAIEPTPTESPLEDHHEALQIVDGVMHSIREGTGSAVTMGELRTIRRAILSGRPERDTPWDEPGVAITVARPARQTVGARPGREL